MTTNWNLLQRSSWTVIFLMCVALQDYYNDTYYSYFIVREPVIISKTFSWIYLWTIKRVFWAVPCLKRASIKAKGFLELDTIKWGSGKEKIRSSSPSCAQPTPTTFACLWRTFQMTLVFSLLTLSSKWLKFKMENSDHTWAMTNFPREF